MSNDDREVSARVRGSGLEPSDGFRADMRATITGAMSDEVAVVTRAEPPARPSSARWWLGAAAAVAVVVAGVVVAMPDDERPTISPATTLPAVSTVPATTTAPVVAPTSTVDAPVPVVTDAVSDPDVLAALTGRRWALASASDGSYDAPPGLVPWIEFSADPIFRGFDGCNLFGADGTIDAEGAIQLANDETESTAEGCDGLEPVSLFAGRHVTVIQGGAAIELTTDDGTAWTLRPATPAKDTSADGLVGVWSFGPDPTDVVRFGADGTVAFGTCSTTFTVDGDGVLLPGLLPPAVSCGDAPIVGELQGVLTSGPTVGPDVTDPTWFLGRSLLLASRDRLFRLVEVPETSGDVVRVSSDLTSALAVASSAVLPVRMVDVTPTDRRWPVVSALPDGSFLVLDTANATLASYDVSGSARWSVAVPADIDGARPWSVDLGPDGIAYLSYQRSTPDLRTEFVLAAVPTTGPNAGVAVATWPTDWECVETFCGSVRLVADGVLLGADGDPDAAVQPYVDDQGRPSGAAIVSTATPSETDEPLPPGVEATVPVPVVSEGTMVMSVRSTVRLGDLAWRFDVVNALAAEGTYSALRPLTDGGVLSTFSLADAARPGEYVDVWVDLLPDGSVQAWRLPRDLGYVQSAVRVNGERVAVVQNDDGSEFRIVRLVPA